MNYSRQIRHVFVAIVAMSNIGCAQEPVGRVTTFDNVAATAILDIAGFQDSGTVVVIAAKTAEVLSFDPKADPIRVVHHAVPGGPAKSLTSQTSELPSFVYTDNQGGGTLFRITVAEDWEFTEIASPASRHIRAQSVPPDLLLAGFRSTKERDKYFAAYRMVDGHMKEMFQTPRELSRLSKQHFFPEELTSYAVSPDGGRVVVFDMQDKLKMPIFDTASGRIVGKFENADKVTHFTAGSFSPDGSLLVATNANGRVTLWDANSRLYLRDIGQVAGSVGHEVRFLNQGMLLFVCVPMGEVRRRSAIKFWDGITFEPIVDIVSMLPAENEESRTLTAVATSEDGSRVLIGDGGGRVHIWTAPAGDLRFQKPQARPEAPQKAP